MSDPSDQRLEALEVKIAFQEKLLADLDDVVQAMRDQIEAVERALTSLTEEVQRDRSDTPATLEDEVPPHY